MREHTMPLSTIVSMTNAEARMWEIAENLHRAELTSLDRKEQIAEWIELKRAQVGQVSGGRGNKGVISAAAEQLGVTRQEAQRSVRIASITKEAKAAARDAGIDDNQCKLLEVAKEAPERQVARVHELKNSKPEPVANDDDEDEDDRDIEADVEPENYRGAFLIRADQARRFAVFRPRRCRPFPDGAMGGDHLGAIGRNHRAQARAARMNAPLSMLDHAVAVTRRHMKGATTPYGRLKALWAGAKHARNLGSSDVVAEAFSNLASEFGDDLGKRPKEDAAHVLLWAQRGVEPFGKGGK
jgi:hypothetical protein